MLCFNIPHPILTEVADTYFFQAQCLCWFSVFIFRPGHSTTKSQACFLSVSVLGWWTNGITSEILFMAKCCHREWVAHALLTLCSGFAHALLTLAEVPFESLRATAHALLTLCSRCSRFGGSVYFDEETPPCHTFLFRTMCTLRHTAFRLQTPCGRISNLH